MSNYYAEPESQSSKPVIARSLAVIVVILIAWWFWPWFVWLKISYDLRCYAVGVRQSDVEVNSKVRLLDQIDATEKRLGEGRSIGIMKWWSRDTAIREMLQGEITADEVRLIERELRQVEKRLK